MKTICRAGVLSLFVLGCSFSVQAAVNPAVIPKVSAQSRVVEKNQANEKIDLNKAGIDDLANSVKGIGIKRAEAILKYRETIGSFKSIAELSSVPGLGANFVKKHQVELEQRFRLN